MKEKLYLAYGSNLNIVQMIIRCPDAKFYGTAEIKDYELLFKGSKTGAYLTIAYIMHEDRRIGIPSPVYINTCREGYKDFGFDINILMDAVMRSKEATL